MSFYTFALPILAIPLAEKARLMMIVSSALKRSGTNAEHIGDDQVDDYLARHPKSGFNARKDEHKAMVRGAIVLGVKLGWIEDSLKEVAEADQFVAKIEAAHGSSPLVFIASDLVWDCHTDDYPTFREFTTLCAVNSVIGLNRKAPVLIRRQMLIARQLGYKTPAVMQAELAKRKDQTPMTTQELRTTLDRLEARELVFRCQASRRCVYFSNTTKTDELRKAVQEQRARRDKVALRRDVDRETFGQQPNANHSATTQQPLKKKSSNSTSEQPLKKEQPEANQTTTTGATTGATTEQPLKEKHLNKSSLNNSVLNKSTETRALKDAGASFSDGKPEEAGKPKLSFTAYRIANRIIANEDRWHYDNCKVDILSLETSALAAVLAPHLTTHNEAEIIRLWQQSAKAAHASTVDELADDPVRYCVGVFKRQLEGKP